MGFQLSQLLFEFIPLRGVAGPARMKTVLHLPQIMQHFLDTFLFA
jgi:hypothetical protein